MAIAMRGLKIKPTHKDLIGAACSDGLEISKSLTEMYIF